LSGRPRYVLGSGEAEVERLDQQAAAIAPATALLLRAAGIGPGMRVLDLGTGPGHVAFLVAELVGPEGTVLGVDQSDALLAIAESRRGGGNLAFEAGDARTFRAAQPFDAIVTRLLLFHLPDAVDVLRHHRQNLRPGGLMVAIDYDIGAARAEPPVELAATVLRWVEAGFRAAGAEPRIGARLGPLLRAAGYEDVSGFGVQGYLQPDERRSGCWPAWRARSRHRSWRAASPRRRSWGSTRSTRGSLRPSPPRAPSSSRRASRAPGPCGPEGRARRGRAVTPR
jgi:SAM-dependent methyltransferase